MDERRACGAAERKKKSLFFFLSGASKELMKSIQLWGLASQPKREKRKTTQQLIHFFAGLSWPPAKKGELVEELAAPDLLALGPRFIHSGRERLRQSINFSIPFQRLIWFAFSLPSFISLTNQSLLLHSTSWIQLLFFLSSFVFSLRSSAAAAALNPQRKKKTRKAISFILLAAQPHSAFNPAPPTNQFSINPTKDNFLSLCCWLMRLIVEWAGWLLLSSLRGKWNRLLCLLPSSLLCGAVRQLPPLTHKKERQPKQTHSFPWAAASPQHTTIHQLAH